MLFVSHYIRLMAILLCLISEIACAACAYFFPLQRMWLLMAAFSPFCLYYHVFSAGCPTKMPQPDQSWLREAEVAYAARFKEYLKQTDEAAKESGNCKLYGLLSIIVVANLCANIAVITSLIRELTGPSPIPWLAITVANLTPVFAIATEAIHLKLLLKKESKNTSTPQEK